MNRQTRKNEDGKLKFSSNISWSIKNTKLKKGRDVFIHTHTHNSEEGQTTFESDLIFFMILYITFHPVTVAAIQMFSTTTCKLGAKIVPVGLLIRPQSTTKFPTYFRFISYFF